MSKPATATTDERLGLPSASASERIDLCPGSVRLSQGVAKLFTKDLQQWAESGDRVHLYCEDPAFVDLSPWPDELDVALKCLGQRDRILFEVFGEKPVEAVKETRYWLANEKGEYIASGRFDFAAVGEGKSLNKVSPTSFVLVDYKSNRGDITDSPSNKQLRALAVLFWINKLNRGGKGCDVAIIQPLVTSEPSFCHYTPEDLAKAEAEWRASLAAAADPNAPLNPSEKACKYCDAKLKCPAAREVMQELAEREASTVIGLKNTELASLLELIAVAETIIKPAKAAAKALLKQDPASVPGWCLEPSSPTREVTDPFGLFEALFQHDLMDKDTYIKECVSVGIGDLEKSIYKLRKDSPDKLTKDEVKKLVNQHGKPFITPKSKEPSLKRAE